MAARADIWLRTKNRKPDSWYYKGVRLKTKDATEARTRARLAKIGKWPPPEEAAAKASVESFALPSEQVGPPMSGGPSGGFQASLPTESVAADSEEHQPTGPAPTVGAADWTNVAAAAAADASAEPIKPEVVDPDKEKREREEENANLAMMVVGAQLWATGNVIRARVYDKFAPPEVSLEQRAELAAPYATIANYAGVKVKLPAWVTGLVFPAIAAVTSAAAMARAWADLAREQKAAAERSAPAQPEQAAA